MRDFLGYKQHQKDLEREREIRDKMEYNKMVNDAGRKQDEKDR